MFALPAINPLPTATQSTESAPGIPATVSKPAHEPKHRFAYIFNEENTYVNDETYKEMYKKMCEEAKKFLENEEIKFKEVDDSLNFGYGKYLFLSGVDKKYYQLWKILKDVRLNKEEDAVNITNYKITVLENDGDKIKKNKDECKLFFEFVTKDGRKKKKSVSKRKKKSSKLSRTMNKRKTPNNKNKK